jgi:hypothetical protein
MQVIPSKNFCNGQIVNFIKEFTYVLYSATEAEDQKTAGSIEFNEQKSFYMPFSFSGIAG